MPPWRWCCWRWFLVAGALWKVVAGGDGSRPTAAQLQAQQNKIDALEQRSATLARSDQISRDANGDLQGTLAERDEEIAGLRADVAFYERFVGATAQRRGLAVHELQLQPQSDLGWHFIATLTQNLNRGAVNAGRLQVAVEGTRAGKLQKLGVDRPAPAAQCAGRAVFVQVFRAGRGRFRAAGRFQAAARLGAPGSAGRRRRWSSRSPGPTHCRQWRPTRPDPGG